MGHSADRSVEPRSGQHAEADADICGKGAARGTRAQTRPALRLGLLGLGQVSPAQEKRSGNENGTGHSDLLGPTGTALTNSNMRRGAMQDRTYKADIKSITLNIVSPEKRPFVLEALDQTEAERKYGRAPPTAMESELQAFLDDLLKTRRSR